ncbi:MAG TPA: TRAP transporter substrate-binding protein [Alcaligenaceae bacterium]|nr:TRAP transporter substrate-binding protein [Alcaligenaceae bacterium]
MFKKTLVALACATATLASGAAHAEKHVLKVAHFWPAGALSQQKVLEPWCAKIAEQSNNRLECQIYPAMQLGGTPPQLIQQAADGVADIVWTLPGYTAGRFPIIEAFELPFMARDAEGASRALWEYYETYAQDEFASVKPLAFNVHDAGHIHNNRREVKKISDLRGVKMRAPTRQTNIMLAKMGATPVSVPLPQMADALSKGVVSGYVLPWEVVPTMRLHELTKFHTEMSPESPSLYTTLFTIAMNKARYEGLPADLQKIIDDNTGADFSAHIGKQWDESVESARKQAVDHGNTFYTIPADQMDEWLEVGDRVAADWVKDMDRKGLNGQEMLDTAKALIAKHSKQ